MKPRTSPSEEELFDKSLEQMLDSLSNDATQRVVVDPPLEESQQEYAAPAEYGSEYFHRPVSPLPEDSLESAYSRQSEYSQPQEYQQPRHSQPPEHSRQREYPQAASRPARPQQSSRSSQGRTPPTAQPSRSRREAMNHRRRNQIILIASCAVVVALIGIFFLVKLLNRGPKDSGTIYSNVWAAGVNLGGLTPEEAKVALKNATDNTYTKYDMEVKVQEETLTLSPADTGAQLNVDAVVDAAYQYGRGDSAAENKAAIKLAASSSYHIDILPYLTLNKSFIQTKVSELETQFTSALTQSKYEVTGTRPEHDKPKDQADLEKVYQTLTITLGTPQYALDSDSLYEDIMDAYNSNLFTVRAELTATYPDELDLDGIYKEYCVAPVDAVLNEQGTQVVKKAVYGYGFDLEKARTLVSSAAYGAEISVEMTFIRPALTEEEIENKYYVDTVATCVTTLPSDSDQATNVKLAFLALNDKIVKPGESFSFNSAVGQPTSAKGYKTVKILSGKDLEEVMGGGISQAASMLYYCALAANLEVTQRTVHLYAPDFIDVGLDAEAQYGTADLVFKNTSDYPIRISAKVSGNTLTMEFLGTNTGITAEVVQEIVKTYKPATLKVALASTNAGSHKEGDVLVEGISGYDVKIYRIRRDASGSTIDKETISYTHYEKRNRVVVTIKEVTPVQPPEPTNPTDSTAETQPTGSENPNG